MKRPIALAACAAVAAPAGAARTTTVDVGDSSFSRDHVRVKRGTVVEPARSTRAWR